MLNKETFDNNVHEKTNIYEIWIKHVQQMKKNQSKHEHITSNMNLKKGSSRYLTWKSTTFKETNI